MVTVLILGLCDGSSCTHHIATFTSISTLPISFLSSSSFSTNFPRFPSLKQLYAYSVRIAASSISNSTHLLQQMISNNITPKLYTSTFTVTGVLLNHFGATYPFVPLMPVSVWLLLLIKSFANLKSEIFAVKGSSKRMF
ncbi:hypothetical protein SLE2022_396440 [Rubroshorea leprosula]